MTQATAVWIPAADEKLAWFAPAGAFPETPGPLEYTLEVHARAFGLTRALSSLNFPLYELRTRLVDGNLQVAVVPSGLAERDMDAQFRRLVDASVRFTRNIRGPWENTLRSRPVRDEVASYNDWMAEALPAGGSPADLADGMRRLQRVRGMQWYAAVRAVFGPAAMLQRQIDDSPSSDAAESERLAAQMADSLAVAEEARQLLSEGGALLDAAAGRAGTKLAQLGALDDAADVRWLELEEVREALRSSASLQATADGRKAAPTPSGAGDAGPEPPDTPEMYLVPEILALIGQTPAAAS